MVLTFRDTPAKKDLLKKVGPAYSDQVQTMWECFALDAIVRGHGFELIRLVERDVEMIVQKTMFYTKIRLRYINTN